MLGGSPLAKGLFVLDDGKVMVNYGRRQIPISQAQYKANGYRPPLGKLGARPAHPVNGEESKGIYFPSLRMR